MNVPGCLLAVGYLLTFFVAARVAYVRLDRATPGDDGNGFGATAIGALWPVVVVCLAAVWIWDHTIGRETPRQRAERLRQEHETLVIEAGKLGLLLPVDPDTKEERS